MVAKRDFGIHLEGLNAFDLPATVLRDLCDLLIEGSQRSVRLAVEGRSQARGAVPGWLSTAADVRVTRYAEGSLDLGVQAPVLRRTLPEQFAQTSLFSGEIVSDETALDLFLDAVEDATANRGGSQRLDIGILDVILRAGGLFSRGGQSLSITRTGRKPVVLDAWKLETVRRLSETTPSPRAVRVTGVLDTLTASNHAVVIKVDGGREVRGFAGAVSFDELRKYLGCEVVVEGEAAFRPSGEPTRIEIDFIAPSTDRDRIFARVPRVSSAAKPRIQDVDSGLERAFGQWPGDETDEEIERLLEEFA